METAIVAIEIAAAAWTAVSLAGLLLSLACALARPFISARRRRNGTPEPVSVVIPLKLLDEGFEAAQASVLRNAADMEIIVTAREAASPAVQAAQRVFAAATVPVRFLNSSATFAASPKIDNLAEAFDAARHDIVFMKDSNIEIPPDGIAAAVAALRPDVGLVCAIPKAIGAKSFAAQLEAQVMNQSHGRLLLAADALGMGFGVGKIMVFRRSVLARAGGIETVAHTVGEDAALAEAFAAIGLRTAFMGPPIMQRLGARRWRDVFDRQVRWTAVRAANEGLAFALEPLGLSLCAAAGAAIAAPLFGFPAWAAALGCLLLWFLCETALALAEGWDVSITAPAVMVARDAMMVAVWLRAWFTDRVVWAEAVMPVTRDDTRPLPAAKKRKNV
jgi:ceramide glucosyltransferase